MIEVRLTGHSQFYAVSDLLRLFFGHVVQDETQGMLRSPWGGPSTVRIESRLTADAVETTAPQALASLRAIRPAEDRLTRRLLRIQLYQVLATLTGRSFPWGSLTGVRPTWLVAERRRDGWSGAAIARELHRVYHVSPTRAVLAVRAERGERRLMQDIAPADSALYIHIPFCPSRCSYCSFVNDDGVRQAPAVHSRYVAALRAEMDAFFSSPIWQNSREAAGRIRTIYVGGGTPISLAAPALVDLLDALQQLPVSDVLERCFEAGRPDQFESGKLVRIRAAGFDRICLNPQTFRDTTLERIGRGHTTADTLRAYAAARQAGFSDLHMDLIGGLPGESAADLCAHVERAIDLGPESISIHALARKRGAQLDSAAAAHPAAHLVAAFDRARRHLRRCGYEAASLYRQKQIAAGLENCTYARPGYGGRYNPMMLGDQHTVLAFGAGAITKCVGSDGRARRGGGARDLARYLADPAASAAQRLACWLPPRGSTER